ncbi:hypothetical protein B0H10DRAFT_1776582 [Mycena sp. CBHHK59/15]|nr:hypothetical protein B0H10DRAFT_1776582 [Mycena sp. CBHHK59/15]
MSTLELIWDAQTTYNFWSWTNGKAHYTARFIRRLSGKNNICTVRIGARGSAPRSNMDESADVAIVKMAFTPKTVEALAREAQFYEKLRDLQGAIIPRCLGHFRSKVAGTDMACLVLDYCVGMPGEKMRDLNRKAMCAAYALHSSGVMHGDLLDGRHYVTSGRDMMIVDFTAAVHHQCIHGIPVHGPDGRPHLGVCPELKALENMYGVHRRW